MIVKSDEWESSLRPQNWNDYIGQEQIKENLRVSIAAAKQRESSLEHILFYGNSGLGKTSLALVVAKEMEATVRICSGPSIERAGDLASLLTNLQEGDVLFLDEAHRIPKIVMESLYSAMEDFQLHLIMGKGPMARTLDLSLPRFTLIGATTQLSLLPAPLRNRFGHIFQFSFYNQAEIERIITRTANMMETLIDSSAISLLAERSRFTPRLANRLLKRVRDFALIEADGHITLKTAQQALTFLRIDGLGLEPADRQLLKALITKLRGGPSGLNALAALIGEDAETIADVIEPYLLRVGLLERTPIGRIATAKAYSHLGFTGKNR